MTRTELHEALIDSVVYENQHDYGREARWPRLLRLPGVAPKVITGGRVAWQHVYRTGVVNVMGDEQLTLSPDGEILFQRATISDVDLLTIDFPDLTFDTLVFLTMTSRLVAKYAQKSLTVELRLYAPVEGRECVAHFNSQIGAEQPHRLAYLAKSKVDGSIQLSSDINVRSGQNSFAT